ncbi:MAG: hypothetical protein COA44_03685 [Arcobacter sp.]|nr:MAG: hypothetical protein COA44_03685 [Arcobacter sp.]
MSTRFLKPTIILFALLFIAILWMQKQTLVIQSSYFEKVKLLNQEELFTQELELKVNKLKKNFTINYDQLNMTIRQYFLFHKKIHQGHKNDTAFQALKQLSEERLEEIDYFKRANSITHNSLKFIHFKIIQNIFMENTLHFFPKQKKGYAKILQLLHESTDGSKNIDEKIVVETEQIKSFIFTDKKAQDLQKLFLMHIEVVLKQRSRIRETLHTLNIVNKKTFSIVKQTLIEIEKQETHADNISKQKEWIGFFIILTLLAMMYYFAVKLIKQESEIKKYSKRLEKDVVHTSNALQEKNRIYQRLFNDASDGIALIKNGLYIDCNEAFVKQLRYSKKGDIINNSPSMFSPKLQADGQDSSLKEEQIISKVFQKGSHRFEWIHQRSDGSPLWCDVSLTHIISDEKDLVHCLVRDISKQKSLESKLEDLNKDLQEKVVKETKKNQEQTIHMLHQSRLAQMGEMISMIAHQWRQPLSSISAISGTLSIDVMMDNYNKEFFQEHLEDITRLSQHLSSTIDDFRDFFKNDKIKKTTSLEEIVHTSLAVIGSTLESEEIIVETKMDTDIRFQTYPNEVKQVLLNLLKNAQEAIQEKNNRHGKIWIHGYLKNDVICLSVKDNAQGIPKEIIEKIFDPYFSSKKEKDGTGLGLYMSKMIIKNHCKGDISVKNCDNGACFTLCLPLKEKLDV